MAFDANALAKAAGATPFKRPENGQFRPGSNFQEYFFDETGDTNALSIANADFGGWGGVLKLTQANPTANTGKLSLVYRATRHTPASTTSPSSTPANWPWSRTPATCCTPSATRWIRDSCST